MDADRDSPGTNDNASGTAAMLEAARILGGLHQRATLVLLCVAGEEQGLLGSTAQAKLWKEQGKTFEAMFTMDIVGGATGSSGEREPWRLRVFSEGVPSAGPRVFRSDNDAPSRQLPRYLRRAAAPLVPGFKLTLSFRQDRFLRGGDHLPFFEEGWPAVRLTEPHENFDWQHQDVRVEDGVHYGDVSNNVDFDDVARLTKSVTAAAAELALAGYAILWRRTDEPDWTHRLEVGNVTTHLLEKLSKDDWLFAVEAVDHAGHRSLPVYPAPKFHKRNGRGKTGRYLKFQCIGVEGMGTMASRQLVAASSVPLLLSLLSTEESYGYALIARVRELSGGALEWTEGMLYPVLHRLEQRGLIESRWGSSPEGRRRKYYSATDAGIRAADVARREWLDITSILETVLPPRAGRTQEGSFGTA